MTYDDIIIDLSKKVLNDTSALMNQLAQSSGDSIRIIDHTDAYKLLK